MIGETVTLLGRAVTGRDALGNDVYTATETPAPGAVFVPGGSMEQTQGADQVTDRDSFIWISSPPNVAAVDAIRRTDGTKYEVQGNGSDYSSPFSNTRVLQVFVEKVTG